MKVGIVTDSIGGGAYTQGTTNIADCRKFSDADILTGLLNAAGYNATAQNTFCDNGYGRALTANVYDPLVVMGAGWQYQGGNDTQLTLGGNYPGNSTTLNPYGRTFSKPFNQIDIYYISVTSAGSMGVYVNNALVTTIDTTTSNGNVVKQTINVPGGLTTGQVDVRKTATDGKTIIPVGIAVRNTLVPEIEVYNLAISGSSPSGWIQNALGYNILPSIPLLGLDLAIISLTMNPSLQGISQAAYETSLQTLIGGLSATIDCIISSTYAAGQVTALTSQPLITASAAKVAAANNKHFVNPYSANGQFSELQAAGNFPAGELIHVNYPLHLDSVKRQYAAAGF